MVRRVTGTFLTGLMALLPLLITIGLVAFLAGKLYGWLGPGSLFGLLAQEVTAAIFGESTPTSRQWVFAGIYVLSLLMVLVFIWLVGYFARLFIGQRVGGWFEWLIGRIPFINKIYSSADQVVDLFKKKEQDAASALSNVVLVRFANTRILGMLSNGEPIDIGGVPHYMVYFPSSPVPATGFNYFVPCEDVEDVDVAVEEMTRIIVSLGSLAPGIMNSKPQLFLPRKTSIGG